MALSEAEQVAILEDIARNDRGAIARIQSIKLLRQMAKENEGVVPAAEFAKLYDLGPKQGTKRRRSTHGV